VNLTATPRFGKGVKLRHDADGSMMLLVPEGALVLNPPAAAALELIDGRRTLEEIIAAVIERFDVAPQCAQDDLGDLFDRLSQRGFLT
jgi:pyrroloquinoline quinone biosynthesis protein D